MLNFNKYNKLFFEIFFSFDKYIETKREIFPRFYFISNDEILKIIAISKNIN